MASISSVRKGPRRKPRPSATPSPFRVWPSWLTNPGFLIMHIACLGVIFTEVDARALVLCAISYLLQMFGITAGYHRYFSHRTFKTSRVFQFVLGWLGCSASQKGPLWWTAHHRNHHRTSDTPGDLHSPVAYTFWQSHVGWIYLPEADATDERTVRDLTRYPELRWLDRHGWVPPVVLALACLLIGGWSGLFWGFFMSSLLTHHATFMVNSVCHIWGWRRYATGDASRNNLLVALLTLGEGWHNNHHHYQSSANQGFRWYEIDVSYYVIRMLSWVRVVWDVRTTPPDKVAG